MVIFTLLRFGKVQLKGKPKKAIITGSFYVLFMIFQTVGLVYSSSIEGAITFAIIPIIVQIMATVFLKGKATILQNMLIIMVVGALIYMILMGAGELHFSPLGTTLLLLSSVCMAVNNVMMRYVRGFIRLLKSRQRLLLLGFIAFNIALIALGDKKVA